MNLIKQLFGKKPLLLEEYDIINYFSEKRIENDTVEYKSWAIRGQNDPKAKEDAVIKTICGMLNSNGGVIIWGSPAKTKEGEDEFVVGSLVPVEKNYDKDAFMAKIIERIIPAPTGISFYKINLTDKGKYIYIFRCKESSYKPHQFEGIYYMRLDGHTRKAPHHYIEALMKQIRFPKLELYLKVNELRWAKEYSIEGGKRTETGHSNAILKLSILILNMTSLENEENITYSMSVDKGAIIGVNPRAHANRYANSQRIYFTKEPIPLLSFGEKIGEKISIELHQTEALRCSGIVNFNIQFGGRKSPSKRSYFKINLYNYNPDDPDGCIIESNQNKLAADLMMEQKISKNEMINSYFKSQYNF